MRSIRNTVREVRPEWKAFFAPDVDDGPRGVELTLPLYATTQGYYAVQRPDERTPTEIAFVRASDGAQYVASGHRVTPKVR